ncbi:MAG: putative modification methylase [Chloroflexi bacterium]|nr:putative modification methylase [Chloroflexota bacterium]
MRSFPTQTMDRALAPLLSAYRAAESHYRLQPLNEPLGRLFSFAFNTQRPVHRWYMFKEGFAADLVGSFIHEFRVPKNDGLVVDPFSGSGTTALESQFQGYSSRGVEVNPFFADVASTKLRWLEGDVSAIRASIDEVLASPDLAEAQVDQWPELTSFKRLYSESVLSELFRLKARILHTSDPADFTSAFLLLGLTSILELTSKAYKTGKGLKFRKRQLIKDPEEVRERVRRKWLEMLEDISTLRGQHIEPGDARILRGDARSIPLEDGCASLVVYSPPYANTFDYNEVYKLEMWFMDHVTSYEEWRRVKEASLRSHVSLRIGAQEQGDELLEQALSLIEKPARGEVEMLRAYFADMRLSLLEQKRICQPGARVVIIVGNSSYRCVPIATDLILARLAESVGFSVEQVRVGRRLNTSSQQMALYNANDPAGMDFIRESAVILHR